MRLRRRPRPATKIYLIGTSLWLHHWSSRPFLSLLGLLVVYAIYGIVYYADRILTGLSKASFLFIVAFGSERSILGTSILPYVSHT
jgi:hypothetical protein